MGKIKIMLNEYGQSIGENSWRFSSAIGCKVRNTISVACVDWRLVDAEKKFEVWTDLKVPRGMLSLVLCIFLLYILLLYDCLLFRFKLGSL